MQLSKRLQAVSDMVTSDSRLADVGTDHAYIPIWLLEAQRIKKAIAMDINKGPLKRAAENIAAHGLTEQIETRLSDGLAALQPGEADSIVIAGMGGHLVIHILENGKAVRDGVRECILQPQSDIEQVRRYLQQHDLRIIAEDMILEDGKFYPMMKVVPGRMNELSGLEYKYGPCLLGDRHSCLAVYLEKRYEVSGRVLAQLRQSRGGAAQQRKKELEAEMNEIRLAQERII